MDPSSTTGRTSEKGKKGEERWKRIKKGNEKK
jgi:hypothetical protein